MPATPEAKLLGKTLVVEWTKEGGTMMSLDIYSREFSVQQSPKEIDVSTRGDIAADTEDILAGVPSREITIGGLDSDEVSPDWETINIGDTGELVWYRQGKGVGKPVATVSATCTGSEFGSPYDDANTWSITFKATTAIELTVGA